MARTPRASSRTPRNRGQTPSNGRNSNNTPVFNVFDGSFSDEAESIAILLTSDVFDGETKSIQVRQDYLQHIAVNDGKFGPQVVQFNEDDRFAYQMQWLEEHNDDAEPEDTDMGDEDEDDEPMTPPPAKPRRKPPVKKKTPRPVATPSTRGAPGSTRTKVQESGGGRTRTVVRVEVQREMAHPLPVLAACADNTAGYTAKTFRATQGQVGAKASTVFASDLLPPLQPDDQRNADGVPFMGGRPDNAPLPEWFDPGTVHQIERDALPEWFDGRSNVKTWATYVEYRNYIVRVWQNRPTAYLAVTPLRRLISCDVGAIMRLHEALTGWGLINVAVDPATDPDQDRAGPVPVTDGSAVLPPAREGGALIPMGDGLESAEAMVGLTMKRERLDEEEKEVEGDAAQVPTPGPVPVVASRVSFHCNTCNADCSAACYHSIITRDYDLCQSCYQAVIADEASPADFIRVGGDRGDVEWTPEETLLLLEGLEAHGADWDKVSDHVGATKTKRECARHFLQLPIADAFLDGHRALPCPVAAAQRADVENPVMSAVAALAAHVSPNVARAASAAAVAAMRAGSVAPTEAERVAGVGVGCLSARVAEVAAEEEKEMHRLALEAVMLQAERVRLKMQTLEALHG